MTAPATVDEFLAVVAKSKLLEGESLGGYLQPLSGRCLSTPGGLAEQMVQDGLLTRFQVENLLQGKWLGFHIGPYKVLERVGAGSTGAVYRCSHAHLRRQVAVKVLLRTKAQDEEALRRFEREARAAAALDHPNIVHAFDVGREGRLHYLVLEFISGVSLLRLLREQGPPPPAQAADYLRQAARGLQHAHEAGLVHRDVKPSNLMVSTSGVVKVLDLGLARFFEDECDLTRGAVLGDEIFMAPEQALHSHEVDARADVYSLGATFYLLLTGQRALPGGRLGRPGPRSRKEAASYKELMKIILRMMALDPNRRYQTAGEVAEQLASWGPPRVAESEAVDAHGQATAPVDLNFELDSGAAVVRDPDVRTAPEGLTPTAPAAGEAQPGAPMHRRRTPKQKGRAGRRARWLWAGVLAGSLALVALLACLHQGRPKSNAPTGGGGSPRPVTPHSP
jgi:hypothetical protein